MLAYTFYENDGRVMRYAEALAQEGAQVDAIVLGRPGQPLEEFIQGVGEAATADWAAFFDVRA